MSIYVPATDGDRVASSDRPDSAVGRVVLADKVRDLEIYEYRATLDDDLDVWFQHPGDKVLFLLEGELRVDFAGRPSRHLRAGDCLVHSGESAPPLAAGRRRRRAPAARHHPAHHDQEPAAAMTRRRASPSSA